MLTCITSHIASATVYTSSGLHLCTSAPTLLGKIAGLYDLGENVPSWHDVNGDPIVEKTVRGSVSGLTQNSSLILGFRKVAYYSLALSHPS